LSPRGGEEASLLSVGSRARMIDAGGVKTQGKETRMHN